MKQKLLFLLTALLFQTVAWADNLNVGDIFTADNVKYKVTSTNPREVQIGGSTSEPRSGGNDGNQRAIDRATKGVFEIPSSVIASDGNTYTVRHIGHSAFDNCILTEVIIPNTIISIREFAFWGCNKMTNINIPASVEIIEDRSIPHDLETITVSAENTVFDSRNDCNAIIETLSNTLLFGCINTVIPNSVKVIGPFAFSGCFLNSIDIPNSVTAIKRNAFYGCTKLTNITFPNKLDSIDIQSFEACRSLTSIVIPSSVTKIKTAAFKDCKSLKTLSMSNNVTEIADYAFDGCESLTNFSFPASLKSIGGFAFFGCSSLTAITIPKSVEKIDYQQAFQKCVSLTSIVVESGNPVYDSRDNCNAIIETSSNKLVQGCKTTVIPSSVTAIGRRAFQGHELTTITISKNINKIEIIPFMECNLLTSITVESGNSVFDSRDNCNGIIKTATNELVVGCQSTIIPSSVTKIGVYAFDYCKSLTSIRIPNTVSFVDNEAFASSGLTSVYIGSGVEKFGTSAFNCYNLKRVRSFIESPTDINENVFNNNTYSGVLYVPVGTKSKYEAVEGWKKFCTIEELDGDYDVDKILYVDDTFTTDGLSYKVTSTDPLEVQLGGTKIGNYYYATDDETAQTLSSVEIPASVVGIDDKTYEVSAISDYAFQKCSALTEIHSKMKTPHPIKSVVFANAVYENAILYIPVGSNAFYLSDTYGWGKFKNIVTEGENIENSLAVGETFTVDGITYCVTAPFEVMVGDGDTNNNGVAHAADASISGDIEIPAAVTGPDGYQYTVSAIQRAAFYNCKDISSITLPNTIASIQEFAFEGCSGLASITIPRSVVKIGAGIVADCSGLKSIVVEKGNSVYDSRDNCNAIIETLGSVVISGCQTTVIPDGVKQFDQWSFAGITGLTSFTFPEGTKTVSWNMFTGCTNLASVKLPNSIKQIDGQAFCECSSLTSIVIPKSVTNISNTSFQRCDALKSIIVDEENTVYDSRENCNAIIKTETNELVVGCSTTVIPNTVIIIGKNAFWRNEELTSIIIPNSVKIIGGSAFYGSGLTSITIPNSVDSLGNSAFWSCKELVKVISEIQKPFNINKNVFSYIHNDAVLYVPEGTKALYEAADGWKEFKTIKEMGLEPVDEGDNVDYGEDSDITEETNLDGLVVNNMFYSIGAEAGGYDAEEGCIIITKETSDEQMELIKDLGITDEELNENFTGIIFKVPAGRGTVTVNAEAEGNMTLKVKVGDGQTVEMELEGKLKMKFPYNVNEESLVYIFAGTTEQNNARRGLKAQEIPTPCLKIYGIEWENRTIAGDANGDGIVDEKDIVEIVNFLMGKPSEKFNKIAADANGDNVVNVADIVTIVDILRKE